VPYFDERCGMRFADGSEFTERFNAFYEGVRAGRFHARSLVVEKLTLEDSARKFVAHLEEAGRSPQ
jgi:hypothetical protein